MTGNRWYDMDHSMKQGYVMGAVDAYSTANHTRSGGKLFISNCIPNTTSSDQLVKIIDKYLTLNPESLHYNLDAITALAISNAFNCKAIDDI